jgi:hypothetical protein
VTFVSGRWRAVRFLKLQKPGWFEHCNYPATPASQLDFSLQEKATRGAREPPLANPNWRLASPPKKANIYDIPESPDGVRDRLRQPSNGLLPARWLRKCSPHCLCRCEGDFNSSRQPSCRRLATLGSVWLPLPYLCASNVRKDPVETPTPTAHGECPLCGALPAADGDEQWSKGTAGYRPEKVD